MLKLADPIDVSSPAECVWYQTFEWPDGSVVRGRWDYRRNVDDYLGRIDYQGKTVLEIGPASGYLTYSMEERGARVTGVDTSDETVWEVAPRHDRNVAEYIRRRNTAIMRLRKAWWLVHKTFSLQATVSYTGAASLREVADDEMHFDIGFIGSVLQHFENPYVVLSSLARFCDTIVISEQWLQRLEIPGRNLIEFLPAPNNNNLGSWWLLSSSTVEQMMGTLNFKKIDGYRCVFRRWDLKDPEMAKDTYRDADFWTHVYERVPRNEATYNQIQEG